MGESPCRQSGCPVCAGFARCWRRTLRCLRRRLRVPWPRSEAESLAAEVLPLAEACKWLHRHAARILRPRRLGRRFSPMWLVGVSTVVHRAPVGCVLIIGPGNYPLMLPGIQIVQALAAGNRVLFKPAPGTSAVARVLVEAPSPRRAAGGAASARGVARCNQARAGRGG